MAHFYAVIFTHFLPTFETLTLSKRASVWASFFCGLALRTLRRRKPKRLDIIGNNDLTLKTLENFYQNPYSR